MTRHAPEAGPSPWSVRLAARLAALGLTVGPGPGPGPGPGAGTVSRLTVEPGLVTALVRQDTRTAWAVRVGLVPLTDAEWSRAEQAMAADSAVHEQLLDGELPPDADALFARAGLPLLPAADRELVLECDCPDWAVPCGPQSAVLTELGAVFDSDPFQVTAWRGRDRRALLDAARARTRDGACAGGQPPEPAPPGGFWDAGPLPVRPRGVPAAPAVAELARPAVTVRGRNLGDALAPAYEAFLSW